MAKKKRKYLKRVEGGYKNKHGVIFTEEQKKDLERSVRRSNYQRKKALEQYNQEPHITEGKVVSKSKGQLYLMDKENDFIVSHQPRTLQNFKSMEEYEKFMDKQARIQSGEYLDDKARLYKKNFMNSLRDTYGDEAKDIIMKVRMMKPKDYIQMVSGDEVLEISYVPSTDKTAGRLNQIRRAMGMKEKDEWPDEEYNV